MKIIDKLIKILLISVPIIFIYVDTSFVRNNGYFSSYLTNFYIASFVCIIYFSASIFYAIFKIKKNFISILSFVLFIATMVFSLIIIAFFQWFSVALKVSSQNIILIVLTTLFSTTVSSLILEIAFKKQS